MRNLLGTGELDPERERKLIEDGVVFAKWVIHPDGHRHLTTFHRPPEVVAAELRRFLVSLAQPTIGLPIVPRPKVDKSE